MAKEHGPRVSRTISCAICALFSAVSCYRGPSAESQRLRAERDRLAAEKQELERELAGKLQILAQVTKPIRAEGEVLVAVPNRLLEKALQRALSDGLNGLTLHFQGLKVDTTETIKVKVLLVKLAVGRIVLRVVVRDLLGQVSVGAPSVHVGNGAIATKVPVTITGGRGRARMLFHWFGRGVSKAVCGNVAAALDVVGRVAPVALDIEATATLAVRDHQFVLNPKVPNPRVRLVIEPSTATWDAVEGVLNAQTGLCRTVLRQVNVPEKLRELLARGIPVTLPTEKLKPVHLPLVVTEQVEFDSNAIEVMATPSKLEIGSPYTWFVSSVHVQRAQAKRQTTLDRRPRHRGSRATREAPRRLSREQPFKRILSFDDVLEVPLDRLEAPLQSFPRPLYSQSSCNVTNAERPGTISTARRKVGPVRGSSSSSVPDPNTFCTSSNTLARWWTQRKP